MTTKLCPTHETLFTKIFCAPKELTRDEVQDDINKHYESGTTAGWRLRYSDDNPIQCEQDKDKQHWIAEC